MQKLRYLLILFFIMGVSACNDDAEVKKTLEEFMGMKIQLPLERMRIMKNGKDFIMPISTGTYKEVIFVDSAICTSCTYKYLFKWNAIIENTKDKNLGVDFLFILHPSKSSESRLLREMVQPHIFNETVFIDTAGLFIKNNPDIPAESQYHTFLLDMNNRVIMVGNPTRNQKLHDLFFSKLKP